MSELWREHRGNYVLFGYLPGNGRDYRGLRRKPSSSVLMALMKPIQPWKVRRLFWPTD
jgi:hypothetical protein